jgi:hypothetical protein
MQDPVRSVLTESLAETRNEAIVQLMIPIMRKCGVDAGLSLQLSSWVSKGSHELKLKLLQMIGDIGGVSGGPALRMALFDDSEDVAALAARVTGKIRFMAGLPVLLKVAVIWQTRFPDSEVFLAAVCQALGDLARPEGIIFLQDIAGNRSRWEGRKYSLALRWDALQALAKISQLETLAFLKSLGGEKDPQWRKDLEKMAQDLRPPVETALLPETSLGGPGRPARPDGGLPGLVPPAPAGGRNLTRRTALMKQVKGGPS